MSLKIDHIPKFTRPMSDMRRVLMAIEQGYHSKPTIVDATKLQQAEVNHAIKNLLYIKAILRGEDRSNRKIYYVQGQHVLPIGECWSYASSAFTPSLPKCKI
jgi:hypothetical protein